MAKKELIQPKLPEVKLPAGFKIVNNNQFAKSYIFEKIGSSIQGKVIAVKEVKIKNKLTRVMTLETAPNQFYGVWESVQLKELFDMAVAKKVKSAFIQFDGEQKVKGYKNKMKLFTVAAQ